VVRVRLAGVLARGAGPTAARRRRPLAAVVSVLAVAASGCTGGSPAATGAGPSGTHPGTAAPVPKLDLSNCNKQMAPILAGQTRAGRKLLFSCGTLAVPVDHADPAGRRLPMSVVRVRMFGQRQRIGSLVINPGGPGVSGVEWAAYLAASLPVDVLRRFDIVGFDPRGVGRSDPVRCVPATLKEHYDDLDAEARTDAAYNALVRRASRISDACYARYGDRLGAYNITATARDMELLRQALGEPKLTYLGYSYGTLLGAVYATLYPANVRAFVLDGAVDPAADEVANSEGQARGFEAEYDRFAADCVRRHCPLGRDPRAFLTRLLARVRATPIRSRDGRRRATDGTVLESTSATLYARESWPTLARALADAGRGDATRLFKLGYGFGRRGADGGFTNFLDGYLAFHCGDARNQITSAQVRAALADWRTRYPIFGTYRALNMLDCVPWKAPRHPPPTVAAPAAAATILVVGTRHDPATPYAGAQRLRDELGNATLLTWDGDRHTAYPLTACVNDAVGKYLIGGTVPAPTATCPAG